MGRTPCPYNIHYDPTLHDAGSEDDLRTDRAVHVARQLPARDGPSRPPGVHGDQAVELLRRCAATWRPTLAALCTTYVQERGFQVQPLVEAILRHPLFYQGPLMVIPPAIYVAGLHRALKMTITTSDWSWIGQDMGQLLFFPPDVGGWDYTRWLDTARWQGRLTAVNHLLANHALAVNGPYATAETPAQALTSALQFWAQPTLTSSTTSNLIAFGNQIQQSVTANWQQSPYWVERQNALRTLIPTSPDWQTC